MSNGPLRNRPSPNAYNQILQKHQLKLTRALADAQLKEKTESEDASKSALKVQALTSTKNLYGKYLHVISKKFFDDPINKAATSIIPSSITGGNTDHTVKTFGDFGNPVSSLFGLEKTGINPLIYESIGADYFANLSKEMLKKQIN